MSDPRPEIADFLAAAGWAGVSPKPLAGDASLRRYWRVKRCPQDNAVLMDAPPNTGETTEPFLLIAGHLEMLGYSAPHILMSNVSNGLILMEDLGDDLFTRIATPGTEPLIYEAAVDLLTDLAGQKVPDGFPTYDFTQMAERASLAGQWYAGSGSRADDICDAMTSALCALEDVPRALALRDFHAENLLWLPERDGIARVGLLDFQDAMSAPIGYDLISLLYDARRDVSPELIPLLVQRFANASNFPLDELERACAILGAQRSLRIIGVFARLSLHFKKVGYVDLIPRVWSQLEGFLAHPELSGLRKVVRDALPPPSADHLADLRARCGTVPTL